MVILKKKYNLDTYENICRYNKMIIQEGVGEKFTGNKSHHVLTIVKAERWGHRGHYTFPLFLYMLEMFHNNKDKTGTRKNWLH